MSLSSQALFSSESDAPKFRREIHTVSTRKITVGRYALAILAAIAALLLRHLLSPLLGANNPYHTLWVAVVFASWYCGVGPSVVTTLIGLLGVWYWLLPPAHSFALQDPRTAIFGMISFLLFSGFIIALGEANRRSKERYEREIEERMHTEQELRERETELKAAHAGLESRVQERTAEINTANRNLRQLSARLLQLQDDERRRLARELHDSVGQMLAAITMNIGFVQSTPLDPIAAKAVAENASLVDQITLEIRTISHLLHPPLLDEAGLASAIGWYVEGFSQRSKIAVNLELASGFGRLHQDIEIAIFRIVQECLTNVHRHSGSRSAVVRLDQEDGRVRVEIADVGKGIPIEKQKAFTSSGKLGVGFRGMRERIAQLDGVLEIHSDANGTVVMATLPLEKATAAVASEEVA